MEGELKKEYSNGELTVVWKPKLCIHAEECVKRLPEVYKPKEKPWIQAENASTDELVDQISNCPSGALSFFYNDGREVKSEAAKAETKIDVLENGPLLVHGDLEVTGTNGEKVVKENTTAFCRCGASNNKPYCDGMHNKIEFKG